MFLISHPSFDNSFHITNCKKFDASHETVNISASFAVFSNEVKYVTNRATVDFNARDAAD